MHMERNLHTWAGLSSQPFFPMTLKTLSNFELNIGKAHLFVLLQEAQSYFKINALSFLVSLVAFSNYHFFWQKQYTKHFIC